jgi:membrane protein implicated in regulation of membrane protease activity
MILLAAVLLAVFVVPAPWNVVLVAGAVAFEVVETYVFLRISRRRRVQVGAETMVGQFATVVKPLRPEGSVRFQGELWRARCDEGALPGEEVRVRGLDGLTLEVERA